MLSTRPCCKKCYKKFGVALYKQEKVLRISQNLAIIRRTLGATDPIRTDDLLITSFKDVASRVVLLCVIAPGIAQKYMCKNTRAVWCCLVSCCSMLCCGVHVAKNVAKNQKSRLWEAKWTFHS